MKAPRQLGRDLSDGEARRTLADLMKSRIVLIAICRRCKNRRLLFPGHLIARGESLTVADLRPRLRCSRCGGYGTANLHEATR